MHSTSWKVSLHIVYISKNACIFLTKCWYSDQTFSRNIFTPLFLNLKHLRIRSSRLLCYTYYLLFANILKWHQLETYIDDTQQTSWKWSCGFSWNFLQNVCNFLAEMATFKQAIKLTFGRNKFGKRTVQDLQTRI